MGAIAAPHVFAQAAGTVTLTGSTTASCTYSSMAINPSGGVTVTCSSSPTPNPNPNPTPGQPGSFYFATPTASAQPNASHMLTVSRTGGTSGSYRITINPYGWGCATHNPTTVDFGDGVASAQLSVNMASQAGTFCDYYIKGVTATGSVAGGAIGTPDWTRVTVDASANPPTTPTVPTVPGCPAPPDNMITRDWPGGPGNPFGSSTTPPLAAASGQVTSIPLPKMPNATGELVFFELASSPDPYPLQISINRCPGVIETDTTNFCNLSSSSRFNNKITWFQKAYSIITGTQSANARGYCWAGDPSVTQYYVNARWSYNHCPWGAPCGFGAQYNLGPY